MMPATTLATAEVEPREKRTPRKIPTPLKAGAFSPGDRKSTRLNSSHVAISYAVFCLKKKNSSSQLIPVWPAARSRASHACAHDIETCRTICKLWIFSLIFFFFNDTATTEIYTLSLHDALPIWQRRPARRRPGRRPPHRRRHRRRDRKSTRLNSSHVAISYAVFCLKKKKKKTKNTKKNKKKKQQKK